MTDDESLDLIHFTWGVPDHGYIWDADARADPDLGGQGEPPFLVVHPETTRERQYAPLPFDEPGGEQTPLFQRFSNLELTQDAILQFANEYGWLGVVEQILSQYYPGAKPGEHLVVPGEGLGRWMVEVTKLREASILWQWLEDEDEEAIARAVRWESETCVSVRGKLSESLIRFNKREHEDLFHLLHQKDASVAVRAALLRKINKNLRGQASASLLLDRKGQLQGFLRPHNLLAALWLQLYQAVLGQRRVRACIYCGKWMDVTGSRRDKEAHLACVYREKTYRLRRRKALAEIQERLREGQLTLEVRRRLKARKRDLRLKLKR